MTDAQIIIGVDFAKPGSDRSVMTISGGRGGGIAKRSEMQMPDKEKPQAAVVTCGCGSGPHKYPIEKMGDAWVVWSMPPEHNSRRSAGLELFESYPAGMNECSKRNLLARDPTGDPMT